MHVGNGERTLFRLDNWINGSSASRIAPYLFQVISKRVTKRRAVAEALAHRMWIQNIRGDLSVLVLRDYIRLWQVVADVHISRQTRTASFGDGTYTAASAYRIMHQGSTFLPGSSWVWKNWAPQRMKFFTWLALKERL